MIKETTKGIILFSAEKDGIVKELFFDWEKPNKKAIKGCDIVVNSICIKKKVYVMEDNRLMMNLSRRHV